MLHLRSAKAAADALTGAEKEAAAYYAGVAARSLCNVRCGPWRRVKRRGIGSSALSPLLGSLSDARTESERLKQIITGGKA